jgi:hypothetical protein
MKLGFDHIFYQNVIINIRKLTLKNYQAEYQNCTEELRKKLKFAIIVVKMHKHQF